jgi:GT2 family glycosyltransferase
MQKSADASTYSGALSAILGDVDAPYLAYPDRLVSPNSWAGHIPFAFWLIEALRPRVLVELGVHAGTSYAAFCQAVQRADCGARCYGVDTWQGDEHAGFYGDQVYNELAAWHDARYAGFSRLVRSTFDDAVAYFEPASIDLLHIDGLHTYEAVRHDFETWVSRTSSRSVVLLHDTNVREREFGVWRLWGELVQKYPAFEFIHGHGLGVLGVGSELPSEVRALFEAGGEHDQAQRIRRFFSRLGDPLMRDILLEGAREESAGLQVQLSAARAGLARSSDVERALRQETESLQAALAESHCLQESTRAELVRAQGESEAQQATIALEQATIASKDATMAQLQIANRALETQRAQLEEHLEREGAVLAQLEERMRRIRRSLLYWPLWGVVKVESELRRVGRRLNTITRRGGNSNSLGAPWAAPQTAHLEAERIRLPPSASLPEVSVLVLSYGHVDHTLGCLRSIANAPPACVVEMIVSDDCSGADLSKLREVENLRLLDTPENLGFLMHANWAVAQTRGAYVMLLNNDTELKAGAIDALVETARRTPKIGLVGSKLIFPNGTLQEAGGIVWNDASAWNYGRGDSPDRPQYNYVRDVDYVSGAAILFPRAAWDAAGGFDPRYVPAYCEDSDFAFKLRQQGLRVIYQPSSVVVHHEGVSHGTDVSAGVKAHQSVNQERLKERWAPALRADHWRNGEHVFRARDRARNRPVTLVVDHYVPQPDRDAGSRTVFEFIRALQADGHVVKFWPENLFYHPIYTRQLQQMGVETFYAPWELSFEKWLAENGSEIDLVLLSRPSVAKNLLSTIRKSAPKAPVLFYGHDLHHERLRFEAQRANDPALASEAAAMEAEERAVWRQADLVLYPSLEEANRVKALEPSVSVRAVLPYCFENFAAPGAPPTEPEMIFVAGFTHGPNAEAARWLVEEALPRIRERVPNVRVSLVGSNPTPTVRALAGPGIDVTGYVSDQALAQLYRNARLAVVPLQVGAGIKLKVVEAMQMARPLVTTSIGAQGLPGLADVAVVEDEADAFAAACITLLQDDVAWRVQAERQSDYVRDRFSVEALRTSLASAIACVTPSIRRSVASAAGA